MIDNQRGRLYAEAQAIVKNYRHIEELIPGQWSEGDVIANGIRLHYYRTGGDKPVLLLLHGFNEYVDLESLRKSTKATALFIAEWCGVERV